ncbi:MAG: hypothetical protein ACRDEA_19625 [Microcystaceae cyanobacterium]
MSPAKYRSLPLILGEYNGTRHKLDKLPIRHGADYLQRSLLEEKGIQFTPAGKIDLRQYQWQP